MTRKNAEQLLPVMEAYSKGKQIQYYDEGVEQWFDTINPSFVDGVKYRIKLEPKFRSFKDADECWNEMLKHQPFGWVRDKETNSKFLVKTILNIYSYYDVHIGSNKYKFNEAFDRFTFINNSPFGIKEV